MNYRKIMVPVDFSSINHTAIEKAKEVQQATGCHVSLVHVIGYVPPPHVRAELPDIFSDESLVVDRAEQDLEAVQKKSAISNCDTVIEIGNPRKVLPQVQKNGEYDLVIMARHSRTGMNRLLGSTANAVVNHADCDVLIIPD